MLGPVAGHWQSMPWVLHRLAFGFWYLCPVCRRPRCNRCRKSFNVKKLKRRIGWLFDRDWDFTIRRCMILADIFLRLVDPHIQVWWWDYLSWDIWICSEDVYKSKVRGYLLSSASSACFLKRVPWSQKHFVTIHLTSPHFKSTWKPEMRQSFILRIHIALNHGSTPSPACRFHSSWVFGLFGCNGVWH